MDLNGHELHDVIDYQFFLVDGVNHLRVERGGGKLDIELAGGVDADPGISFSAAIFDRIRTCRCGCIFCFVAQLPRGLRKPLYLRDDDFRLSFLYGNFITLGNLTGADIDRILSQRLSPLYVSVHTTDPQLRGRMMGTSAEAAARALGVLKRLGEGGIRTHIQLVLCPGINDGDTLARTLHELAHDFPGVTSIGAVPVAVSETYFGDTYFGDTILNRKSASPYFGDTILNSESESPYLVLCPRNRSAPLRPFSEAECRDVISRIEAWQARFRRERGEGFVYAADEFYLRARQPLPPLADYDDFPQYQNGIGIAASFRADARQIVEPELKAWSGSGRVFLLTGKLAAELMTEVCDTLSRSLRRPVMPIVAENRTFGPHVTVTGLLGGRDILLAAEAAGLKDDDLLLIPPFVTNGAAAPRFIDDLTLAELQAALPGEVAVLAP